MKNGIPAGVDETLMVSQRVGRGVGVYQVSIDTAWR